MKKRVLITLIAASMVLSACGGAGPAGKDKDGPASGSTSIEVSGQEEPEEKNARTREDLNDQDEAVAFMVKNYGFKEEDLEGLDVKALIDDYALNEMEYTAEEVWRIVEEYRDHYAITDEDRIRSFIGKVDEIPKDNSDLKENDDISMIGFYENSGTFQKYMLFDLDNKVYSNHRAEEHALTDSSIFTLKNIPRATSVRLWDHRYDVSDGGTTGSYTWKIVFLLSDGRRCVYGGHTDSDHLPAGYSDVADIFDSF